MIEMRLVARGVEDDGEGGEEEKGEQGGDEDPVREEASESGSDSVTASTEGHRHCYR